MQGRADTTRSTSHKQEPSARAVNPGGADQLGQAMAKPRAVTSLFDGRGFEAPRPPGDVAGVGGGRTIHPSGSQGKR